MKWIAVALAAWAMLAANPVAARPKHHVRNYAAGQCVDRPQQYSWDFLIPGARPAPAPNGCSPPVYTDGRYIGQDPDPNIRYQLNRDPATGYAPL